MKNILLLIVGFVAFLAIDVQAQTVLDLRSPYNHVIDTVTNTGTAYVSTPAITPAAAVTTTVWVSVTKISGTVGGTITLQGSLDGVTYKAAYALNTATALSAFTATDATNTYHWIISGSPYRFYRVSYTGTGTMAASFSAKLFRAK